MDPAERGVQTWHVRVSDEDGLVGTLRATRGLYWKSDNLRERLSDEQSFLELVSEQLLNPDGSFSEPFEEFVEMSGSVLVVDRADLATPWDDALLVAGMVASIIDRLTDNYFAVVFPRADAPGCAGDAPLLAEAAGLLGAEVFSDELQIIDTCLAAPEQAAERVRRSLLSRARNAGAGAWANDDGDGDDETDDGPDYTVLTARTAAVLRLALQELSTEAWQEVVALGGEPMQRGAAGVFGCLPPVTLNQDRSWRRQMARAFDDLAADLTNGTECEPRSTGEEMALHLGIARAEALTRNRPRRVAEAVAGLAEHRRDFDWEGCSNELFQDHDVLMLFDQRLDGVEDGDSEVNRALGMVNLAPLDWFTSFDPDLGRDPERGFQNP